MNDLTKTSSYFYDLPEDLIAQTPIEPRDHSRLLVYNRSEKQIEHKHFYDIVDYLKEGDVLVVNNTKVIPCRLIGKKDTGAVIEVFIMKKLNGTDWEALVKPGKRCKIGTIVTFSDKLKCEIIGDTDFGGRIVRFIFEGTFETVLSEVGVMPLPPYIKEKLKDQNRYQTVYAKLDGSAAAPTAGLHFTPELMQKIKDKGVKIAEVLLHVGLGTFRPVKCDNILEHDMHSEYFEVTEETAKLINDTKAAGGRVIAVGTTSVRVLESASEDGKLLAKSGNTKIFIYPSYKFKMVDCLITNFHLPESTLIMLVSAFAGYEDTMNFYNKAVEEKYRFFSFGDSTFIY